MDAVDQGPPPGTPVASRLTKFDDTPHWHADFVALGTDGFGHWLGAPTGSWVHRPGAEFTSRWPSVRLVPHDGCYLASINAPGNPIAVYVDVTTRPTLRQEIGGWTLRAADLDLDVVRRADGTVFLDDVDEFAEHRRRYGYPPDLVAAAERTADELLTAVRSNAEPYAAVATAWLEQVAGLSRD